jgi:hypothetical protein
MKMTDYIVISTEDFTPDGKNIILEWFGDKEDLKDYLLKNGTDGIDFYKLEEADISAF